MICVGLLLSISSKSRRTAVVGVFVDGPFAGYDEEALGLTRETPPRRSDQSGRLPPLLSMSYILNRLR